MKGKTAWATNPGMVLEENQDALLCEETVPCYAVSDGMGGVLFGKESAEIVCSELKSYFQGMDLSVFEIEEAKKLLKAVVSLISEKLCNNANGNHSRGLFGATLTGVYFHREDIMVFHVGDSRGYVLRKDGSLQRLTRDDNMYEVLLEMGEESLSEENKKELQCRLLQYMGMREEIVPVVSRVSVEAGERLLLCSDGLTKMLQDDRIRNILQEKSDIQECANELIFAANEAGGKDNISVILWDAE